MTQFAPSVCILVDQVRPSCTIERPLSGFGLELIQEKLRRVGLNPASVPIIPLEAISTIPQSVNVVVALGKQSLIRTTEKSDLDKYQLSPLDARPEFSFRKVIPSYPPERIVIEWKFGFYLELALRRAREESAIREYERKPKRFLLNPDLLTTHEVLEMLARQTDDDWLSIDLETGRGQVNTVGFAWSPSDAIAIKALPEMDAEQFFSLWRAIARVVRNRARKIMQNGIFEQIWFSRYGIHLERFAHDTMVCNKFLYCEFDKGLGNVGRLFTREVYWKDDGRVESEEGKQKDWGNIRDWDRHFDYNCKDSSGQYEAAMNQRAELKERGLLDLFDNYIMACEGPIHEMCVRGLPVCGETKKRLTDEYTTKVAELTGRLSIPDFNPRSVKQKIALFKDKGWEVPKSKKSKSGMSTDELALKKLRMKYPEDSDLKILLELIELQKALSSYFGAEVDPLDGNIRYQIGNNSTETGRWNSTKDPWDRGFNAQTIPAYAKGMIAWPTK